MIDSNENIILVRSLIIAVCEVWRGRATPEPAISKLKGFFAEVRIVENRPLVIVRKTSARTRILFNADLLNYRILAVVNDLYEYISFFAWKPLSVCLRRPGVI